MAKAGERSRRAEARQVEAGGKRLPGVVLSPDASRDLESLMARGYAHTIKATIERSLSDAADEFSTTKQERV